MALASSTANFALPILAGLDILCATALGFFGPPIEASFTHATETAIPRMEGFASGLIQLSASAFGSKAHTSCERYISVATPEAQFNSKSLSLHDRAPCHSGIPSASVEAGGKIMDFGTSREENSFPAEVSGWDTSDKFFVESTTLRWSADEKKEVALRGTVSEGCVIFVRLLQPMEGADNFPIACQVTKVIGKGTDGRTRVQVVQLRPRAFFRETARELNCEATRVA